MNLDNRCAPSVTFAHAAGCHVRETEEVEVEVEVEIQGETVIVVETQVLTDFIMENPIPFGVFLIVLGIPIALFGSRWFIYVCVVFGSFSAFCISAFTFQYFKLMDTSGGLWGFLLVSVVIGLVIGIILAKFVILGSILIGITAGAFVGMILWAFGNYWTTLTSPIPSLITTGVFGLIGAIFGYKYGKKTIMYGTSILGSYTFMRGVSLLVGGYPGEQVIYKYFAMKVPFELEWQMCIFVTILYLSFTISVFYQFSKDEQYALMVEAMKEQGKVHEELNELKEI